MRYPAQRFPGLLRCSVPLGCLQGSWYNMDVRLFAVEVARREGGGVSRRVVVGGEEAGVEEKAPPPVEPHRGTNGRCDQRRPDLRASIHLTHRAIEDQSEPSGA
jgi:hypothetical protein